MIPCGSRSLCLRPWHMQCGRCAGRVRTLGNGPCADANLDRSPIVSYTSREYAHLGNARCPGRRRRVGRRPRGLREAYAEHVAQHLPQRKLRAAGWPRGANWWSVCKHRPLFEAMLP